MRKQRVLKGKKLKKQTTRLSGRRMVAIMAEVARENVRERLRESTSITVATDESDGRKIFRARCDTPGPPYRFDCVLGVHTKRFGEFKRAVDEVREDHAKRTHRYLESFHRRFFTPDVGVPQIAQKVGERRPTQASATSTRAAAPAINMVCQPVATENQEPVAVAPPRGAKRKRQPVATVLDEDGYNSYRDKVRVLASDGGSAERRALFFSASGDFFPNAALAIKDMTHCIRIATGKPMQMVQAYAEVYDEIVNKRHALLPDIQNSNKWQNILQGLQTEVLSMESLRLSGCLDVVLAHLAFARQRMDSVADPLAKVCLMLMPIALLLASIGSDERVKKEQRDRASEILSKMQPKFLHAMAVSADWGLICLDLLRLFDASNHDISNSAEELERFEEVIKCVFVNGGVFHKLPPASASGGADANVAFITERVRKQTRAKCVFRCGGQQILVWGPMGEADLQHLALNTRVAASVMLERLRADFAGMRKDFACFSLKRVDDAAAASGADTRNTMTNAMRNLGRAFRLDCRILVLEYIDAVPVIRKLWKAALKERGKNREIVPNLPLWQHLLDSSFVEKEFPARLSAFSVLPVLIRIWSSILDGESMVERDFSHVREYVRTHKTMKSGSLIDDMVVLRLSGPQDPQELAYRSASGDLVPTQFLLRCVTKWRRFYGSRYGIDSSNRKPRTVAQTKKRRQTQKRRHTFVNVKRGVLMAARRLTQAARDGSYSAVASTPYGVSTDCLRAPQAERRERTAVWNDKLKRFSDDSRKKKLLGEIGRFGRSAFPKWKERSGHMAETPDPVISTLAFVPACAMAACGASQTRSFSDMGYIVQQGPDRCFNAQLVIIDSLERFHGPCPSAEWALTLDRICSLVRERVCVCVKQYVFECGFVRVHLFCSVLFGIMC